MLSIYFYHLHKGHEDAFYLVLKLKLKVNAKIREIAEHMQKFRRVRRMLGHKKVDFFPNNEEGLSNIIYSMYRELLFERYKAKARIAKELKKYFSELDLIERGNGQYVSRRHLLVGEIVIPLAYRITIVLQREYIEKCICEYFPYCFKKSSFTYERLLMLSRFWFGKTSIHYESVEPSD